MRHSVISLIAAALVVAVFGTSTFAEEERFIESSAISSGAGFSETSSTDSTYGYLKGETFAATEPVRLGLVASMSGFRGKARNGYAWSGWTGSLGLGLLYQAMAEKIFQQTKVTIEGGVRYDDGRSRDGEFRAAERSAMLFARGEHIILRIDEVWFPEFDLWVEGGYDLDDNRRSSFKNKTFFEPDHDNTWVSFGVLADVVRIGEGWAAVAPGLGGEVFVTNEDSSTWFQGDLRLACLKHHVLLIAWYRTRDHRSGSPDEAHGLSINVALWF